jgi:hypothetical protein
MDADLNTRTIRTSVVFRRPFFLTGLDGAQPPGIYLVEVHDHRVDSASFVAYRRVSTSIEMHGQPVGITRTTTIDPDELVAALKQDAIDDSV